ncbi:MAG: DivIVA domain-containing protein [Acutalibacteraceae bacterium]|jgi:cell division initiation protein
MMTADEIRNVKFSRAISGYKADEVEVFLDKVEADYAAFERIIKEYELKIETMNSEIESFKNSQSSIQNVLVNAQKLADQIVKEAKEKSSEIIKQAEENIKAITAHEKELSAAFELKAQEQKNALEKELENMVKAAKQKADLITAQAEERVKHQQMLFDRLKQEVAAFKASTTAKYKEHLELLAKLPDFVPADTQNSADEKASQEEKRDDATDKDDKIDISSSTAKPVNNGFTVKKIPSKEDI